MRLKRTMPVVRGLIDRLLLVCGGIAGGLVPGFIAQYRQRLGGRLEQARLDLAPWQKIADLFFGGHLRKLIEFHLASRVAPFHAEGAAIRALADNVRRLQREVAALHGSLYHQAFYLVLHPDPAMMRATLHSWVPTFGLSPQALIFAAVFAVTVWLIFQALWSSAAAGAHHLTHRLRRHSPARPKP
ncbi:MAG: DUF2937 family protein [Ferrimicrobium sp.]|jgi:hypothetical protein|nr:DUF2937 family protein [Ferrimicrobium sp.]